MMESLIYNGYALHEKISIFPYVDISLAVLLKADFRSCTVILYDINLFNIMKNCRVFLVKMSSLLMKFTGSS